MSMSTTTIVVGLAENTVVNWYNFLREECSSKLLRMPMQDKLIGGVGEMVEVDESVLVKRKYNRQRKVGWIEFVDR